ncbi:anaerobic C4-dicarboxylate transporter family protein [Acetonema longum]|uniref:Anaerobic C4-dicarboxylate transporter n=1 Tax=Acetonema longum DSM 6540 TaxID=1009370 RepID=F7NM34_9FIRM|nr:anaerobic C4-dicarboxylate transporter [Acetonema longum]EGO62889.1 anaerobic C4-dicarboxylate transporter [Acetonema longum DSM 6540]
MFWLELVVLFSMLVIGARRGGLFLGMAGGAGMAILVFGFQLTPANPPINVILIIATVILAAGSMQAAGGMDYMVDLAERLLRKNPKNITFLAPLVVYLFCFMSGTGYVAFSLLPVIAEVARESGVRPERPLSIVAAASQQAVIASPISAATAVMIGVFLPLNIGLVDILKVIIPATLTGVVAGALYASRMGKDLDKDPEYLERVAKGEVPPLANKTYHKKRFAPEAKLSVLLFLLGTAAIVLFGTFPGLRPVLNHGGTMQPLAMPATIEMVMLVVATIIVVFCKVNVGKISEGSVFKSGMIGVLVVFGVAWMSETMVNANSSLIKDSVQAAVTAYPWMFVFAVFAVDVLIASQSVSAAAMMPLGVMLGVPATALIGMYPAVNSHFFLPTSTIQVTSVALDSTKTTKIGKFVLNHSFMMPGFVTMAAAILAGFLLAEVFLG